MNGAAVMKHHLASFSLHSRLLLYFAMVSILPILLIGMASYFILFNVIKERAIQFSGQMISQVASETNNLLQDAYKVAGMVSDDPTIQAVLRRPLDANQASRYSSDLTMDTRLTYIQSSYRNEFFGFYVIGANGGKYKSNFYSVKQSDLTDTAWYRKIVSFKKPVWFSTHMGSYAVQTVGQPLISVGFPIFDKASGKISGVVLIDFEEDIFSGITGSRHGKTGYMYILDRDDFVVSHPQKGFLAHKNPNRKPHSIPNPSRSGSFMIQTGLHSIFIYQALPLTGWKIVGVLPMKELTKDSTMMGWIIAGVLCLICVSAFLAAWTVAGSVANPIKKLMHLMKRVEAGDLGVMMNVKYDDEIGQLGRSFNVMVGEIRKLMDKVYQEQRELRKAELKALQAQINPHFLYNTLDSIIWLSRAERSDDVVKMVTALTKLFRISLSRGRDIISVGEEIEHVRNYLIIQQIRYKNKFAYSIDLSEELYQYQTLKLILQPLVENAIYHGIKMKREPGCITISGKTQDNCIVFEIKDSGRGMTRTELAALENTLKNSFGEKMDSYGLKNVDERIKIFFGIDYGLTFFSEYGIGTRVEVRIPMILEGEENVKCSTG